MKVLDQSGYRKISRSRFVWLMLLLLMASSVAWGQLSASSFYEKSLKINNAGMVVLGSWALANISVGAYGWSRYSGQQMYFHQMNLFWNTVNLAIAGIALYSNLTSDHALWTTDEVLAKQLKTQRLFLINAGLDILYMGTAVALRNLAPRYPKHQERLTGYGNSVLIQGAFLFLFDLVWFGLQRGHRLQFLDQISLHPAQEVLGIALTIRI